MNEICIECCALRRDAAYFELKPGINLMDMPRFPLKDWLEDMNKAERGISIAVYITKIVDCLQRGC